MRDGSIMSGAGFSTITTPGMKLTQLKPIGYEENEDFTSGKNPKGCQGGILIHVLSSTGAIAKDTKLNTRTYEWYHDYDKNDGWDPAGGCWMQYDIASGEYVQITDANDVTFGVGEGFCIEVPGTCDPTMKVVNSGEALLDGGTVDMRDGSKGMVAPLSASVKLTQIKPIGYEENEDFTSGKNPKGCQGGILLHVLSSTGAIDKDSNKNTRTYEWYHDYDKNDGWDPAGGCWMQYDIASGEYVKITDANDVTFEIGEGFVVEVPGTCDSTMKMEFPGIDDDK